MRGPTASTDRFESRFISPVALTFCLVILVLPAASQQPKDHSRPAHFKADSQLVLVPVVVTNSKGKIVLGLPKNSFEVLENKVDQLIFSFSEQDVPASIGFVFDLSGSMKDSLSDAKLAFRALVDVSNREDQVLLDAVSSRPVQVSGITSDFDSISRQIMSSKAGGSTALVDTIYGTLKRLKAIHSPRKGLVVISDGMDNHSRYTKAELMAEAAESDVQVYCISLNTAPAYLKPTQVQEQRAGVEFLEDISQRTGGLAFVVRDQQGMAKAADAIGRALRSQYLIGYVPRAESSVGSWRSIKVRINKTGLQAHSRAGYYSD